MTNLFCRNIYRANTLSLSIRGWKRYLMRYLNNNEEKKNNRHYLIAATGTIFTLAIAILVGAITSIATTPVAATTTTATTPSSSSGIQLSHQPIYQERSPEGNITPINETHGIFTFSGNGTVTLPNTTQTINTTNNGTAIISFATSSGYGTETIRTENGETVTATLYEIVQFNPAAPEGGGGGEGKGIVTAVFQTNSTGVLAPLNGMIAAGIDEMSPGGESHITLWRWESGIPLPTGNAPGAEEGPLSAMNTTTTNATTSTTNVTAATDDEGESQEEIVEEAVGGAEVAE
jgi:hypothetical protein